MDEETNKEKAERLLKWADWVYEYTDDHSVWEKARSDFAQIDYLLNQMEPKEALALWNEYCPIKRRKEKWR